VAEHVPRIVREDSLSDEKRRHMYEVALRVRATITQCLTEMRKGTVRFWIGGPGEEVHGVAVAHAMVAFDHESRCPEGSWQTAFFPHYRSDGLATALAELRGHEDFTRAYFRQAMSKATDPMTRGRQMVMHVADPERGVFPAQSPLGMNMPKAAGYAKGRKVMGNPGVTLVACGDGSTATSDFHEACTAASLWQLPLVIMITDNDIAISVEPNEGRGIKDFEAYARSFQGHCIQCDGFDPVDTYQRTLEALRFSRDNQCLTILHCKVPRLRGHSSSDGAVFRYDTRDPLLELGETLVKEEVLVAGDIMRRKENAAGRDYFEDHVLGEIMEAQRERVRKTVEEVRAEPAPSPGDEYEFIRPDVPDVTEQEVEGNTAIQVNEALNLCLHRMVDEGNTLIWGQDVAGSKGGVFKVTRGLAKDHPSEVINAPINEPLIVGTALGAAHHPELRLLPEIQFGDYSLNTLHWLVHAGNLYWGSGGLVEANLTVRTTVDPVAGGAIYHSMSLDGFYTPIPGWIIVCPSTTYDAYGLLRTSADYSGPVLFLEPKILYRQALGPCLPGEPDGEGLRKARRASGESLLSATDLESIEDYRIPFGRSAERRSGDDLTIVTWSSAVHLAVQAAEELAESDGVQATVIDLRTLVPWDVDAVVTALRQSGRLLVAQQDRPFASFGREIQGTLHEQLEGISSMVVGMRNVPGVGQAKELEEHTILSTQRIIAGARDLLRRPPGAFVPNDNAWLNYAPTRRRS
jgi:2-oxoisovalerate dehydrogenase E1 component